MRADRRRVYLWLGAVAFLVRLFYFSDHLDSAFFGIPILDEKYYDELARRLLSGDGVTELNPGFRPWLYPLFLAAVFSAFGELGPAAALVLQHGMGIVITWLVCHLAMELFGRRWGVAAGWVAGGLYIAAGPPLFFEGELLITTSFTLLAMLCLCVLMRGAESSVREGGSPWLWLLLGALLAVTAQARPNILLLALAVPCVAWLAARQAGAKDPWRRGVAASMLVGVACLALLGSVGWAQRPLVGQFQWLPQSGGINLYLGNKRGADGMQPRQDEWISYGDTYRDSVQVFAEEIYRQQVEDPVGPVDAAAVSRFWVDETLDELRADPAAWLKLMGRKMVFLLADGEITNNKSYDFMRRHESKVLPWLNVGWGLLLALAVLGWLVAWRQELRQPGLERPGLQRPQLVALTLYLLLLSGGILLFFVNGRYRIPLWPALAILAAAGVLHLWDVLRQRRWQAVFPSLAVFLMVFGASETLQTQFADDIVRPVAYRDFFYRSIAQQEKGNLEAAAIDIESSVHAMRGAGQKDAAVYFQQGNIALALEDDVAAFESYRQASQLSPKEPRIFNNMGILHERRGRLRDAYEGYRFAVALADDYTPALANLGLLELRAGRLSVAKEHLRRAHNLGDESLQVLCGLAFLARAEGRLPEARELLDQARAMDPDAALRLLVELEQPLAAEVLGIRVDG